MSSPTPFVPMAFMAWVVAAPMLFAVLRARWALLASLAIGWMFLPVYEYDFAGLPAFNKMMVVAGAALLGAVVFDHRRLLGFRPGLIDIPMVIWCLAPFMSTLANGPLSPVGAPSAEFWIEENLRVYDALSRMWEQVVAWGVPYFLGRVYLHTSRAHRDALIALFIAGVLYIPFCVFEFRMSPQLHRILYGFHPHPDFGQSIRFGGFRPMVFMSHGLMVAFWVTTALIAGVHLWVTREVRSVRGVSVLWVLIPLAFTAVLMKSLGAWILAAVGIGAVVVLRRIRIPILAALMALGPPLFITARLAGGWSGEVIASAVEPIAPERAQSMQFRLDNEDLLAQRALERPVFGWAGWGRNRVFDEYGNDVSVSDGQWILALGLFGLVGLVSLYGWLLIPPVLALVRAQQLRLEPAIAPTVAVCVIGLLFAVDSVPNAMGNPFFVAMVGGLAGFWAARAHPRQEALDG